MQRQPGQVLATPSRHHSPVSLAVVLQQLLVHVLEPDEPAGHGLVDEGRLRAPAERVAMFHRTLMHQATCVLQVLSNVLVRVLATTQTKACQVPTIAQA